VRNAGSGAYLNILLIAGRNRRTVDRTTKIQEKMRIYNVVEYIINIRKERDPNQMV
jgi:hypothetical protein